MPPPLERFSRKTVLRAFSRARFVFPALALFLAAAPARAANDLPDGSEPPRIKPATLLVGGASVAVGSDLGTQPQLGCFRDLPASWQLGLQVRFAPAGAKRGYDYLPLTDVSVRKLWLGDEDTQPIRNSEYFGLSLGGYFAYDFGGLEAGLKPFGTLDLGKYWMPFDNRPLGLDLNLELTRYLSGHLPNRSETTYITIGLHMFYLLP